MRLTRQRALLLDLLRRGHFDADELFLMAKREFPRIGLATVYRNLKLFKEKGLINELHFEEDHHHYEGKTSKEHCHLICLGCGRIAEFESPFIIKLKKVIGKQLDFEIKITEIKLSGLCSSCRR